jgi:hypothetical protein
MAQDYGILAAIVGVVAIGIVLLKASGKSVSDSVSGLSSDGTGMDFAELVSQQRIKRAMTRPGPTDEGSTVTKTFRTGANNASGEIEGLQYVNPEVDSPNVRRVTAVEDTGSGIIEDPRTRTAFAIPGEANDAANASEIMGEEVVF